MNLTSNDTSNTFANQTVERRTRSCFFTGISQALQLNYFYYSNFILTPATALLGIWCFLSNGSVLFVILKCRLQIRAGLVTLCSLTLTDLLWAALVVPLFLSFRVAEFVTGKACANRSDWDSPLMVSSFFLCTFSTVGTLGVMSMDRYLAVSRPMWYKSAVSKRHTIYACCGVWFGSLSIVILKQVALFPRKIVELLEACYVVPIASLIIIFQVMTLVQLHRHNNAVANMNEGGGQAQNATFVNATERHLAVVTLHVVGLLGLVIIPIGLSVVLSSILEIKLTTFTEPLYFPLATLLSGINPILYYRGNPQIRDGIAKLVKCYTPTE